MSGRSINVAGAVPDAVAVIREEACIGCTKCIQSCPTDAIIGSNKMLHTVMTDACTGCGLCLPPCPVDCIDLVTLPPRSVEEREAQESFWTLRRQQRAARLERLNPVEPAMYMTVADRRLAIEAALLRVQGKKK